MLPLHQAIAQLRTPLAKTMIKAHILTGDDCRTKVGIKDANSCGWHRTTQARRETTVDDPSDFSNIFLTDLYVHVELWVYMFHTNSNCLITTGAVDYVN